jgi:hypothetical protein
MEAARRNVFHRDIPIAGPRRSVFNDVRLKYRHVKCGCDALKPLRERGVVGQRSVKESRLDRLGAEGTLEVSEFGNRDGGVGRPAARGRSGQKLRENASSSRRPPANKTGLIQ